LAFLTINVWVTDLAVFGRGNGIHLNNIYKNATQQNMAFRVAECCSADLSGSFG
jgi:hypothetical protein